MPTAIPRKILIIACIAFINASSCAAQSSTIALRTASVSTLSHWSKLKSTFTKGVNPFTYGGAYKKSFNTRPLTTLSATLIGTAAVYGLYKGCSWLIKKNKKQNLSQEIDDLLEFNFMAEKNKFLMDNNKELMTEVINVYYPSTLKLDQSKKITELIDKNIHDHLQKHEHTKDTHDSFIKEIGRISNNILMKELWTESIKTTLQRLFKNMFSNYAYELLNLTDVLEEKYYTQRTIAELYNQFTQQTNQFDMDTIALHYAQGKLAKVSMSPACEKIINEAASDIFDKYLMKKEHKRTKEDIVILADTVTLFD